MILETSRWRDESASFNKSNRRRPRSAIKPLDSGYSPVLTLFYYFHFIVLICVRVRYLRARSLSRAPPTARRPMARARARARVRVRAACARADTAATMLIVPSDSHFVLLSPASSLAAAATGAPPTKR